jgi:hypothetical protein
MVSSFRVFVSLLAVGCCCLALDGLLPTEEIDTRVDHFVETDGSLAYGVPLSGGEMDTCSLEDNELRALQPKTPVVVQRTLILSRCVGVKPIRCMGLVCLSDTTDATIIADSYIEAAMHYAYGDRYSSVSDLAKEYPAYSPEIRRWPPIRGGLSLARYSVRLPDRLVILDSDGNALTSRTCGSDGGYCEKVSSGQLKEGIEQVISRSW